MPMTPCVEHTARAVLLPYIIHISHMIFSTVYGVFYFLSGLVTYFFNWRILRRDYIYQHSARDKHVSCDASPSNVIDRQVSSSQVTAMSAYCQVGIYLRLGINVNELIFADVCVR